MNSYSNKTVLITGATGFIGNNLVDAFMKMGDVKVIALSRTMKKLKAEFSEYIDNPLFKTIAQDIASPLLIDETIDYIFHAAGSMEGRIIKNFPVDVIKPNIIGTINCLEYLKKQREKTGKIGRIIIFSSVTVYGNNTGTDLTVTEADTQVTDFLSSDGAPYFQSKRMIEVIATSYVRQYELDAVIARFATVYGPTRIAPDTAFFEFVKKGIGRDNIVINTSNLPRRDNIYIDDAIIGVILIGEKGKTGEAYNISSNGELGNYASIDEIAEIIADETGVSVQYNEEKRFRKPGLKLDNMKLRSLDWKVQMSLLDGIKTTLQKQTH